MSMTKIQQVTLASDQSVIDFTSIPATFTDLCVVLSARSSGTDEDVTVTFNTSGGTYSVRRLLGTGSATLSDTQTNQWMRAAANADTASTFATSSLYIPNYRSSVAKSASVDFVTENNGTRAIQGLTAGLWTGTDPITSIRLQIAGASLRQGSSATLYGINRTQAIGRSPQAIGGDITYANGHWVHTFNGSGDFVPFNNMNVEYLVVAGGGGGGGGTSGGGGGGGYRSSVVGELSGGNSPAESLLSLTAAVRYPVIVGSGGAAGLTDGTDGGNGGNSSFSTITSTGGGGGSHGSTGRAGGSGGGAGYGTAAGGAGTTGQGFAGGSTAGTGPSFFTCGGGGGAGQVGASVNASMNGGAGGIGLPSAITGAISYYAGGGGGGTNGVTAAGGLGGGGDSVNELSGEGGDPNTGGGGGAAGTNASRSGAAGGSGVVIVRYRG